MGFVFLSYSRQDRERVRELYADLKRNGFQIWFDEENLLPGQIWETEIKKAIREASLVLVVLSSRSVARRGYAQKEIRSAIEYMDQLPENRPYLVPLRLDDCEVPTQLEHIQCGTLFDEAGFKRLLKALKQHMAAIDGTPPTESTTQAPINYSRHVPEFETERYRMPGYGFLPLRIRQGVSRQGRVWRDRITLLYLVWAMGSEDSSTTSSKHWMSVA